MLGQINVVVFIVESEAACGHRLFAAADINRRHRMQIGLTISAFCMFDVMNAVVNGLNDYRLSQPTFNHGKYP
jgi:hypothetical protein